MRHDRRGFTLTEILFATTLLLMVGGAALSVFLSVNRSMYGLSDTIALNAHTRITLERVLWDLRALAKVTQADARSLAGEFIVPGSGETAALAYRFEGNHLVRQVTMPGRPVETKIVLEQLRTEGTAASRFSYRNRSGAATSTAAEVRAVRLEFAPLPTSRQAAGLTTGQNAPFWSALVQLRNANG